jgi:excisionase family DNA binding protein
MKKPPANYENWLTKAEAAQALQCAEKTIEREASRGKIQQAWRRIPGRRPIAVFNPDDIERLKAQTVQAFPAPMAADTSKALTNISRATSPEQFFAGLARAMVAPRVSPKLYLTLAEAAEYTGLGVGYLRRQIAEGKLEPVKGAGPHGADVLRRRDLEKL